MATITAQMVKELRDKTGAPMMNCKKALQDTDADFDAAIEHLRKAGIMKAKSRSDRAASEGLIVPKIENNIAALAEVCCETDFVARNQDFISFAEDLAKSLLTDDYTSEGDVTSESQEKNQVAMTDLLTKLGENLQLARTLRWVGSADSTFESYVHGNNKLVVLLEVEGEGADNKELLHDIAMHIAAYNPRYIKSDEIPEEEVQKEREIAKAQVEGKPEHIISKIVDGKVNKWFSEICLVQQPWLRDDKTTLAQLAPKLNVKRFVRWQVGETTSGDEDSEE